MLTSFIWLRVWVGACVCVFVLCESCSAKNGGVLHLNFYVRTKVCYDVFCFDFIFVALFVAFPLCLLAAHSLYLLLIMPLAALHFISCIWLHDYLLDSFLTSFAHWLCILIKCDLPHTNFCPIDLNEHTAHCTGFIAIIIIAIINICIAIH